MKRKERCLTLLIKDEEEPADRIQLVSPVSAFLLKPHRRPLTHTSGYITTVKYPNYDLSITKYLLGLQQFI